MKICLIGINLSNLVLAKILADKKISVDLVYIANSKRNFNSRTLGISKSNFSFLKDNFKNSEVLGWPVRKIKIYNEKKNCTELINFGHDNSENFFMVKYNYIYEKFLKIISRYDNVKFIKLTNNLNETKFIKDTRYNLIINSEVNNSITKKYFYQKVEKNYESSAFTCIFDHDKINNNTAFQIFTIYGPLAFLPLSNNKTSVVFSFAGKENIKEEYIISLIKKYNLHYKIKKFNEFEKFRIKFFMLRNYYYKNILSFGDLLHRVHPFAGQGFNMTIRDINILSKLIDEKLSLGLELNSSILYDFQNKTKHLNYIFGVGIDIMHEFFNLDRKVNNIISEPLFKLLGKNKLINKYATFFADKGLKI